MIDFPLHLIDPLLETTQNSRREALIKTTQ